MRRAHTRLIMCFGSITYVFFYLFIFYVYSMVVEPLPIFLYDAYLFERNAYYRHKCITFQGL